MKLKQITLPLIALACSVQLATAQSWNEGETPHTVRLSVGARPISSESLFYSNGYGGGLSCVLDPFLCNAPAYYALETVHTPSISIDYQYRITRLLSVGIQLSHFGAYESIYSTLTDAPLGKQSENNLSVLPMVRLHWLNRSMIHLYSGAGIGILPTWSKTYYDGKMQKNVTTHVTACLTLIGCSVGRTIYGFGEVNISNVNILQAGIGYKF